MERKEEKKWSSLLLKYYPFDYSTYSIIYFKGNNYSQLLEVRPFQNSLTYFDPYKEIIFDNWEKACSDSSLLLDFAGIYCVLAR